MEFILFTCMRVCVSVCVCVFQVNLTCLRSSTFSMYMHISLRGSTLCIRFTPSCNM